MPLREIEIVNGVDGSKTFPEKSEELDRHNGSFCRMADPMADPRNHVFLIRNEKLSKVHPSNQFSSLMCVPRKSYALFHFPRIPLTVFSAIR